MQTSKASATLRSVHEPRVKNVQYKHGSRVPMKSECDTAGLSASSTGGGHSADVDEFHRPVLLSPAAKSWLPFLTRILVFGKRLCVDGIQHPREIRLKSRKTFR